MPHAPASLPARWTSEVQSLARIVFGFLLFRHGMEQVLGFPPALTDYPMMSWGGVVKLLAFPGGILVMLGLFTRPVCFFLSLLLLAYWFVEPLQIGLLPNRDLFGARGPSDPVLLPGFLFMYLAATGPGAWSVDRLLNRDRDIEPDSTWAAYSLGALRIVAAFLFIHHGLGKIYGPNPAEVGSLRWVASFLELGGGPILMAGLFTRPLTFLLSGQMAFAYFLNHAPDGFWASFRTPNQEAAILNCFLFLLLWRVGPGAWSLDGVRQRKREQAIGKGLSMRTSKISSTVALVVVGLSCLVAAAAGQESRPSGGAPAPVPIYQVDPFWPKMPLPNKWMMQAVPVMATDYEDHIWAISRSGDLRPDEGMAGTNPPRGDCCVAAPEILEFDMQGNLLNSWGGPGHHPGWPRNNQIHTVVVDREHNVWISAAGRGNGIQKFTRDGKFLWDFGHRAPLPAAGEPNTALPMNNQQTDVLNNGVFIFTLDEPAREIYLVEGKRVLVYGYDGNFKRGWGGHGMPLSEITNTPTPPYDWKGGPPPDQREFAPALHCVHISTDGLVYVCERGMNRIQVFTKQGKFVTKFLVAPTTPARGPICNPEKFGMCGSTYNLTLSHDPGQQYILVADGTNHRIWIHDRHTGELKGSVGSPGRMAGQFFWIDAIATDSYGNIYTGEVNSGKRVQKFVLKNGDGVRRIRPLNY